MRVRVWGCGAGAFTALPRTVARILACVTRRSAVLSVRWFLAAQVPLVLLGWGGLELQCTLTIF